MPFFSEIKLARLFDFENVTTISDPMALHSFNYHYKKVSRGGGDAEKAWVSALPGSFLGSWPDSNSHQTFPHPGVCVGNREVSGQPDRMPKATGPASYHRRCSIKYFFWKRINHCYWQQWRGKKPQSSSRYNSRVVSVECKQTADLLLRNHVLQL